MEDAHLVRYVSFMQSPTTLFSIFGSAQKLEPLPARIVGVERIAPAFVHLVVEGEQLGESPSSVYVPGQEMIVDVGGGRRRKYSILRRDPARSCVELLVFVHGRGPGADWAASARTGDTTRVTRWRGSQIVWDPSARDVVFLGDETAIPAFAAIQRASPGRGLIQGGASLGAALDFCGLRVERATRGEALLAYARGVAVHERTTVYVVGSPPSVNAIRQALEARGITRVRAKAFWGKSRRDA